MTVEGLPGQRTVGDRTGVQGKGLHWVYWGPTSRVSEAEKWAVSFSHLGAYGWVGAAWHL